MSLDADGLLLPLAGLVAVVAGALTLAQSVILGKRVSNNHPVMTKAVGMSIGAGLLLVLSAAVGEQWALPREPQAIVSMAYLVALGSIGLFVLFLLVMRQWTALATSYAFVLFPVTTMLLEAWLDAQPLTPRGLSGALVVMLGVWFGIARPTSSIRRVAAAPRPESAKA